jgi:large subunit ribosomal protein L4
MAKAKVYNLAGEVVGEQELNPALFNVEINPIVVHQVAVAQQSNSRRPWAHTKTRPEVRGGGKKPWKQKGTGRARHGSSRSPIWRGGGITFGPRSTRNYTKDVNKKMKQAALRMVLTDKANENQIVLVDSLDLGEIKTKQVLTALTKLPLKGYKTLFVTDKAAKNLILSSRNIADVETQGANSLNVVNLMKHSTVVIPVSALSTMDTLYGSKK